MNYDVIINDYVTIDYDITIDYNAIVHYYVIDGHSNHRKKFKRKLNVEERKQLVFLQE